MNRLSLRFARLAGALLALNACAGGQPPVAASYSSAQSGAHAARGISVGSWMRTEAGGDDLVYVADALAGAVEVYSYPQLKRVGRLRGKEPVGDCADHAGNVWIIDRRKQTVAEYAHAGVKPLQTLQLGSPPSMGSQSCSVDSTTGDLAVTSGSLYVFPRAKAPPSKYDIHVFFGEVDYCSYDDRGNLYVDGSVGFDDSDLVAAVWELEKNQPPLRRVKFHDAVTFLRSGGIQWDGTQVAWGNFNEIGRDTQAIYQFKTQKQSGTITGTFNLRFSKSFPAQFWIQGKTMIVPSYSVRNGAVAFFNYPAGDRPFAKILGLKEPLGVTYSAAASR
ncbi:MAG TPA: hypothetical protein VHS56_03050 [Candidatus Cybelea sp.]|nr:hypothetical protein [Candidatus Cybelea sp.]